MKTIISSVDINNIDSDTMETAAKILNDGGLVAFPTETVYGLGANALDGDAAKKIYAAKGRPSDNPLIVHIANKESVYQLADEVSQKAVKLMDVFWPGPLTMIFRKKDIVPDGTTGGLDTVAIRFPSNEIARQLIEGSNLFIAAPSANISGRPSPTQAKHVIEDMGGRIDMIIDGGPVGIGIESTVIDMTEDIPVILRPGFITKEMLEEVVGEIHIDPAIQGDLKLDVKPKAPGMKYKHYAPKGELTIVQGENQDAVCEAINKLAGEKRSIGCRTGIIGTDETINHYDADVVLSIGQRDNDLSVAVNLYSVLREFDELQVEYIYSESFNNEKLGYAIMNRLLKAAGHKVVNVNQDNEIVEKNKLLFICTSNTCRSYMAMAVAKKILMEKHIHDFEVISRGTVVSFSEPVNPKAEICLEAHEYSVEENMSTQITQEDINSGYLILTMTVAEKEKVLAEYENVTRIYTIKEYANEQGEVLDPYGKEMMDYEYCLRELERLVEKVIDRIVLGGNDK